MPQSVEEPLEWLVAADADLSWAAASELARMGERRAIEPLLDLLDGCVQASLADPYATAEDRRCWGPPAALARFHEPRAFEPLIRLLREARGGTRRHAAIGLGFLGDARACDPLIDVVHTDATRSVRHAALLALARLHDARAIELLLGEFADCDQSNTAFGAAQALGEMGEVALQPLLETLRAADPRVRLQAVNGLESLGDGRAVDAVLALSTGDPDAHVRLRAGIVARRLRRARPRPARTRRSALQQRFEILAEYCQFYVGDPGFAARTDPTAFMNQEATGRRLAVDPPGLIGVLTSAEFDVPVTVRVVARRPANGLETWDHVVEASLELTGDFLTIDGPTGFDDEDAPRMRVGPGTYRVRVSSATSSSADAEHFEIVLWREAPYQAPRLLKSAAQQLRAEAPAARLSLR